MRTSLMRQSLAFLALLVAGISAAAFLTTLAVTRSGLTDLFRDRLQRTGAVLEQYLHANRVAWKSDVETLLTSPRFLAALETADAETIQREMPTHGLLDDADIAWVTAPDGELVYASRPEAAREIRDEIGPRAGGTGELAVTIAATQAGTLELLRADIVSNNGAYLGQLVLGRDVARAWVEDLERLTGFEVVLAQGDRVIGRSVQGALPAGLAAETLLRLPEGVARTIGTGGSSRLAFRAAGGEGITAVFLGDPDGAIAPIVADARGMLLLLACVGAAASLGGVWLFARRRIAPRVKSLVDSAARIAAGDLDFEIRPGAPDELGLIAAALESMRADLRTSRRELEDAHRMQLDAERMAAIGQMAAGVVHDFKNPMAVVQGTAELIQRRHGDDEKLMKQCTTIQRQVERMQVLTQDLLEYAGGRTDLEVETVRLVEWLREVEAAHEEPCRRQGVRLALDGPGDVAVPLDPARMRRVIDNVLNNAREVSRAGDTVTVNWSVEPDRSVVLEVRDRGPGIPEDLIDRIFDPFVTAGKANGSGLGLAISRKIVEAHGARIEAANGPGPGARVRIRFPNVPEGVQA